MKKLLVTGSSGLIGKNGIIFNPLDEKDTIDKFTRFMNSLATIENIKLMDKPSLMANHQTSFIKEWEKIM